MQLIPFSFRWKACCQDAIHCPLHLVFYWLITKLVGDVLHPAIGLCLFKFMKPKFGIEKLYMCTNWMIQWTCFAKNNPTKFEHHLQNRKEVNGIFKTENTCNLYHIIMKWIYYMVLSEMLFSGKHSLINQLVILDVRTTDQQERFKLLRQACTQHDSHEMHHLLCWLVGKHNVWVRITTEVLAMEQDCVDFAEVRLTTNSMNEFIQIFCSIKFYEAPFIISQHWLQITADLYPDQW